MSEQNNLLQKLDMNRQHFSKGQRKLADFILENYEQAAFMTAAVLGKTVGVSESTVIRFAMTLGYAGYPDFQKDLVSLVQGKLHTVQHMKEVYAHSSEGEILTSVLNGDLKNIQDTISSLDPGTFESAVDLLLHARHIYVIGLRSSAPLADFLSYYLHLIFEQVTLVSASGSTDIFEQLIRIDHEDVIIGISFPRYSTRTLRALEFASNRQAKVIALTDSINSPLLLYSSCNLLAKSELASIVDSLTAPLSVINALIVTLCMQKQDEVMETLSSLEEVWDEYQLNGTDELNVAEGKMELKTHEKEDS